MEKLICRENIDKYRDNKDKIQANMLGVDHRDLAIAAAQQTIARLRGENAALQRTVASLTDEVTFLRGGIGSEFAKPKRLTEIPRSQIITPPIIFNILQSKNIIP